MSKIVVGIDGSPRQAQVVNAAAELALRFGAQLILARVIGLPPEIPAESWQCPGMSLQLFLEQKAGHELDAATAQLPGSSTPTARDAKRCSQRRGKDCARSPKAVKPI